MLGLLRDLSLKIKTQAAVEADARNAAFLVVVVLRHRVVHRTEPCAVSSDVGSDSDVLRQFVFKADLDMEAQSAEWRVKAAALDKELQAARDDAKHLREQLDKPIRGRPICGCGLPPAAVRIPGRSSAGGPLISPLRS